MPLGPGEQPTLPSNSRSINGSPEQVLERAKLRELCEGFPCVRPRCDASLCSSRQHRDASEWSKFRALFAAEHAYVPGHCATTRLNAQVWTTWSGGIPVDDFIEVRGSCFGLPLTSAGLEGWLRCGRTHHGPPRALACTDFSSIEHLASPSTSRRRARQPDGEHSASSKRRSRNASSCRARQEATARSTSRRSAGYASSSKRMRPATGRFATLRASVRQLRLHQTNRADEKDKCIAVRPERVPTFDEAKLASLPDGYRFLGYAQSATHKILMDLPQLRGDAHDKFYVLIVRWLEGADIAEDMGLRSAS